MVFQNYALYPHMSVYENMAYGLRNRETEARDREAREQGGEILEIERLLDRKPRNLSGGQRQRVAMGRAIVRQPLRSCSTSRCSNLDAKLRISNASEIKKLQQARHDHDLRHARSARSDDARRHAGRHERGPRRADRRAARRLREARDHIRRDLHRRARDEPSEGEGAEPSRCSARPSSRPRGRDRRRPAGRLRTAEDGTKPEGGMALPLTVAQAERVGPEDLHYRSPRSRRRNLVRVPGTVAPAPANERGGRLAGKVARVQRRTVRGGSDAAAALSDSDRAHFSDHA